MHSQDEGRATGRAPSSLPRFAHGQTYAAPAPDAPFPLFTTRLGLGPHPPSAPGPAPLSAFSRRVVPLALALSVGALVALSLTLDSGWGRGGLFPGDASGTPSTGTSVQAASTSSSEGVADKAGELVAGAGVGAATGAGVGAATGAEAGVGGAGTGGDKGAAEERGRAEGAGGEEEGEEGPDLSRPSKCPKGCSEHGTCNEETGECHCLTNYAGPACADHALPRCQLAPGYTPPCHTLTTCECVQDCHTFRLPIGIHCLRGTLNDSSTPNPDAKEVMEGPLFWIPWDADAANPLIPDWKAPTEPSPLTDPASCPESCNGHGACHRTGWCQCPWVAQGGACGVLQRVGPFTGASPACFNQCSGKGDCVWGVCHCARGYFGLDCSLYIDKAGKTRILLRKPYSWASLPPPPRGASRGLRPRVYVYDLPGYFNTWQGLHSAVLDWEEPVWFLERLLNSPYRTADPGEADFFYIPLFIRNRDGNKHNIVPFAIQYVRERWPYYNRSGGSDHMVMTNSDWGNCQLGGPKGFGLMSHALDGVMTLTLWGMTKNMTGGDEQPCFRPGRDIVIPPLMEHKVYKEAPDFPKDTAAEMDKKDILLYFRGSDYSEDKGKPGEYRMSFGARQEMAAHFAGTFEKTGILIEQGMHRAYPRSYLQEMRRSTFCFAPAGWGWAMRTTQAAILGCIPLVIQPDVVQPFQGDGLDWSEFAVFMKVEDIPNTEKILRAYTPEQVLKMQQALFRMRRRFAWSSTNFNPFRDMGTQAAEAGAEAVLNSDSFVAVMDALRLRLKL